MAEISTLPAAEKTEQHYPHNAEAEQALLGALLLNNRLFDELEGFIRNDHFYIPLHGRIFETIESLILKGWEASPITVREQMKDSGTDGEELLNILSSLLQNASLITDIKSLASVLTHNYLQRSLMDAGGELSINVQRSTTPEETEKLLNDTESKLFQLAETGSNKGEITDLHDPLRIVIDRAKEAKENEGSISGITSGIKQMDKTLGGLHKSELIILAARPSMGKTAFALNLATNAAEALMMNKSGGTGVGVFSLEMSADQLAGRVLSGMAEVDSGKIANGSIDDEEMNRLISTANTLNQMPLYIDDTPALHINTLRSRARKMKRKYDVGMIIVDYLQLMKGSADNRVQEISEISQGLKTIARELDVPVVALSQLSRSVENRDNKRPQLSDLRESGSIEQDADVVMFLYREEYYKSKQLGPEETWTEEQRLEMAKIKGVSELLISKNRKGATRTIQMYFDAPRTTFKDYVSNDQLDDYEGVQM